MSVPACAHLQPVLFPEQAYWGEALRAVNEQAWVYRQAFTAPDMPYKRARLLCEGIDYYASVWLNEHFIGQHEGHFVPFTLDITHALRREAENRLTIQVSAPWDAPNPGGSYPVAHVRRGLVKGLYEHGEGLMPPHINPLGIWRPVWLLLDEGISLEHVRIRTRTDGTVDLRLSTSNATGQPWPGALLLQVAAENHDGPGVDAALSVELPPGSHAIEQRLRIPEPRLWWPWDQGEANLYRLRASLRGARGEVLGDKEASFGLRTVQLERAPGRFTYRINGRPVAIRGSSYMPGLYFSLVDRDSLARDLQLARRANLNLLRLHVHVSPPELYELCDRAGMLIWQDFELNWVHDPSPEFEARALALQREMIALLGNHPSIITWACHNEPTMLFAFRENLEQRPDPALYADALHQDPTRPVFLCSGQMDRDWQRSGDAHTYYGALWTRRYTDIYRHHYQIHTEFGFEAPSARSTLQAYPEAWERLGHLDTQIEALWAYQAELIRYHVEHLRRLRASGCAGYVHFWLADLAPQVGCGVLDACRQPKGGYEALRLASQPLHVALEHDGRRPYALWIFNDTQGAHPGAEIGWRVYDCAGRLQHEGSAPFDVAANAAQRVMAVTWPVAPEACDRVELTLRGPGGEILACNIYHQPFRPMLRPRGYPWKFDPVLACKVFDRPGAPSLADLGSGGLARLLPLAWRERLAEWALRQQLPTWLLSLIARAGRYIQRISG